MTDSETGEALSLVQLYFDDYAGGDVSDQMGFYQLTDMKPGIYKLRVSLLGYAELVDTVRIESGKTTQLDISLSKRSFPFDEVQITANRHSALEQNVSPLVSIMPGNEIREINQHQMPELLREEAGVVIQKTNHGGGSPIIRGLRANKLLILIDGIRLNNSTYRGGNLQYLNTIAVHSIDRIEVVHGPVSSLYGSDALGGVLNIVTRDPGFEDNVGFRLRGKAGGRFMTSDDSRSLHLGLQAQTVQWRFLVDGLMNQYGDVTRGAAGGNLLMSRLRNDSRTQRALPKTQSPNGYDDMALMAKVQFMPDERHGFTLTYQRDRKKEVPRYDVLETMSYDLWQYDPQNRDLFYIRYDNRSVNRLFDQASFTISSHFQKEARVNRRAGSNILSRDRFQTHTLGVQVQFDKILSGRHLLIYGSEIYHDRVSSASTSRDLITGVPEVTPPLYPDGSRYTSFGLFMQGEFAISRKLRVNPGVRYSAFKLKAPFDSASEDDPGDIDISPSAVTMSLGSLLEVVPGINLAANIAQGFRAPNLDDISKLGPGKGGNFYDVPNADAAPERVLSFDGGIKMSTQRSRLSLFVFYCRISDLLLRRQTTFAGLPYIIQEGDTLAVYHKENIGKAYTQGLELDGDMLLGHDLTARLALSYTYGANQTIDEPLSGIPPLNGMMSIKWNPDRLSLGLHARFAIEQDRLSSEDYLDLRIPEGGTPGWVTFDIRSSLEFGSGFVLRLGISNILDRNYREHLSGFNAPGRGLVISAEYGF